MIIASSDYLSTYVRHFLLVSLKSSEGFVCAPVCKDRECGGEVHKTDFANEGECRMIYCSNDFFSPGMTGSLINGAQNYQS